MGALLHPITIAWFGCFSLTLQAQQQRTISASNNEIGYADGSFFLRPVTITSAMLAGTDGIVRDVDVLVNFAKHSGDSEDEEGGGGNLDFFIPENAPLPQGTPFIGEIDFVIQSPQAAQGHL